MFCELDDYQTGCAINWHGMWT